MKIYTVSFLVVTAGFASLYAKDSVKTSLNVPLSATVSWSEMVNKQAMNPQLGKEQRVIPMMRINTTNYINIRNNSVNNTRREPADVTTKQSVSANTQYALQTVGSFLALPDNNTAIPPDTMGAVGPNYVMTMLNTQVKIQNKSGDTEKSTVSLATFWQSVSSSPFDSTLLYDSSINKWIAIAEDFDSNILVAVTETSDPKGDWKFWKFSGASDDGNSWPDFPRVGLNKKWIAITANMFSNYDNRWTGSKMWVIEKASVDNQDLTVKTFADNFDDEGDGSGFTLVPAVTLDQDQEDLYIVNDFIVYNNDQYIRVSKLSGDADNPEWSSLGTNDGYFMAPTNFWWQPEATQKGSSDTIDAGDIRIMNAVYTNGKLWFTHGGGLPDDNPDRAAIFWYQIDPTKIDTVDLITQSGVIDPGSGGFVYIPSIAVNKNEDVVIGFTRSNADMYAQAAYTSRSSTDAPGTMRDIEVSKSGEDSYAKDFSSGRIRWGDYSATVVDPADDTIFWTLQEYAATDVGDNSSDDRWGTWWTKIASTEEQTPNTVMAPIYYLLQ